MVSLRQQLARLCTSITTFNIFQSNTPSDNDEHEQKTQLISTRLFIILLVLSLTVLLVYTTQIQVTHTITINSPPLSEYLSLYEKQSDKLACPCTKIAFPHEEFISLTPVFHQVCSSDFVQTKWINFLIGTSPTYLSLDFRSTGSVLFQALSSFCHLANETIIDSLPVFYSNNLVATEVMNMELFDKETQSLVDFYIKTTANAFTQSFEILRDLTYTNGLVSGLFTNVNYRLDEYDTSLSGYWTVPSFQSYGQSPAECDCVSSASCVTQVAIRNISSTGILTNQILFPVPGLYVGCYLVEAMRQSNFQCFYNSTCLNRLLSYLTTSQILFNVTALNQTAPSRFNLTTKVSDILAELMVDQWIENISYPSYYAQCQPSQCIYSIVGRNSFIYVLTTLIGLFGGLYKALKIIVPFAVRIIRNRRRKKVSPTTTDQLANVSTIKPTFVQSLQMKFTKLIQTIRSLNLFETPQSSLDEHRLKTERISTLVYIVLITACLICLATYIGNEDVTQTITIKNPSLTDYRKLYEKQGTKLSCPCSTITSQYNDFLHIEPEFHQFCQSDFIGQQWLDYTYIAKSFSDILDFRSSASLIFHALASYCSLSNGTIANDLLVFQSTEIITSEVLSEEIFHEKNKLLVNSFTQTTTQTFLQTLQFIRTTTYGNQIINGLSTTSFIFFIGSFPTFSLSIFSNWIYGDCSCDISPKCTRRTWIIHVNSNGTTQYFPISGIMTGCYTNEALRQSTFECFYNQSCIDGMKSQLDYHTNFSVTALNPLLPSRYNGTTLIDEILNNMMIEEWRWNDSYADYYGKCRPSYCSYKLITKTPFIVVLTTLIGLFGGLAKILQILVPVVIGFIRRPKTVTETPQLSFGVRLHNLYEKCLHAIRTFNLFKTKTIADKDQITINNQLISTRLFLILLAASLTVLIVYTSRIQITHTVTIDSPSSSIFSSLYQTYGDKLVCPCMNIAISRKEFISLRETYHQICDSDFLRTPWIEGLYMTYASLPGTIYNRDFRYRGYFFFQMLDALCQLARDSLKVALTDFNSASLISTNVLPERVFISQTDATIDLFITTLTDTFVRTLGLLRDTTQGNSLVSSSLSSLSFRLVMNDTIITNDSSTWRITLRYKLYNNSQCSCSTTSKCVEQAYVWTFPRASQVFSIPGMLVGCYTFEAMLQSNLHLFYNQTGIEWLQKNLNMTQPLNITALDPSQSSRFPITSPIGNIIEKMLIEEWQRNISYANYYAQCQPIYCKYSYIQQNDALYIVTTITALIGGLSSALQMIVPRVVKLSRRFCCHGNTPKD